MPFSKLRETWAALYEAVGSRPRPRLACASCGKTPATDASLGLTRVNVKGLPGVFLCEACLIPGWGRGRG
jgi:hypothetical protein